MSETLTQIHLFLVYYEHRKFAKNLSAIKQHSEKKSRTKISVNAKKIVYTLCCLHLMLKVNNIQYKYRTFSTFLNAFL